MDDVYTDDVINVNPSITQIKITVERKKERKTKKVTSDRERKKERKGFYVGFLKTSCSKCI